MPYIIEESECGGVGVSRRVWVPDPPKIEEKDDNSFYNNYNNYQLQQELEATKQRLAKIENERKVEKRREALSLEEKRYAKAEKEFAKFDFSEYGIYEDGCESDLQYDESFDLFWCAVFLKRTDEELMDEYGFETLEELLEAKEDDHLIDNEFRTVWKCYFEEGKAKVTDIILDC